MTLINLLEKINMHREDAHEICNLPHTIFNNICVCVEVLLPSQPIGVMLSVVSLPNSILLGRLSPSSV